MIERRSYLNVIKMSRYLIRNLGLGLYNFCYSMYDNYFHQIDVKMYKNFNIKVQKVFSVSNIKYSSMNNTLKTASYCKV